MQDEEENTLEFEEEAPSETLTRQAYRLPVQGRDNFRIVGGNQSLDMYDISTNGASISIITPVEWTLDTPLAGWTMMLGDLQLADLEGSVIHCTPSARGEWITGIRWLNLPETETADLEALLSSLRQELFESEE